MNFEVGIRLKFIGYKNNCLPEGFFKEGQ